ncbi:MAG: cell division protein FtsZ, partial [Actinomycetota bacterium]|nr:cell division protein FtsZ [Actinomycetota bacterium]
DAMGDEVRVTVIAAGFDRWDESRERTAATNLPLAAGRPRAFQASDDLFGGPSADVDMADDDDFDVPSFLK